METRPGDNGWDEYVDSLVLTPANAEGVAAGTGSAEDAVIHFYASRLRGDDRWQEVLVPERSERLDHKLAKIAGWKFHDVQLIKRKPSSSGGVWLKIRATIEVAGVSKTGTDDVEVDSIDGAWYVSSVPT